MKKNLFMTNHAFVRRVTSLLMLVVFSATTILMPAKASAQSVGISGVNLPAVGTMLGLSESFHPAIIRGMTVYPQNPLQFDFIVDTGDKSLKGEPLKEESQKMIKYFLASLTTPENELWVNLSPYEKDRIVPQSLGVTEMGRDMLAQDYILKQLTASLLYPEKDLGSKFWQKVYEKAQKLYGTREIPVKTFNKVWVVPDKAVVYESGNSVFVVERHLKVMLAEDYEAMQKTLDAGRLTLEKTTSVQPPSSSVSQILKELIIPEIEKEVNEGENFAVVRQIYNSMILATWYKKRLKESLLGQVYVNQNKVKGIDLDDKATKQKIYEQYLAAFNKGVYNYIKEDADATEGAVPRKYFSGGMVGKIDVTALAGQQPQEVMRRVENNESVAGSTVVEQVSLLENAGESQVAAATPIKSALAALGTNASFEIPPSPFSDSLRYRVSGALGVNGTLFSNLAMAADQGGWPLNFLMDHPLLSVGLSVLIANLLYEADFLGYFNNTVDFNLKQLENGHLDRAFYVNLKDDEFFLKRLIGRGREIIPELLAKLEQEKSSRMVENIAYVLIRLDPKNAVEPLIKKMEQGIAVNEIAILLGNLGDKKAIEPLKKKLRVPKFLLDIIPILEALKKLGDNSGVEFLIGMLKLQNVSIYNKINVVEYLNKLGVKDPIVDRINGVLEKFKHVERSGTGTTPGMVETQIAIALRLAEAGKDFEVDYKPAYWDAPEGDYYDREGNYQRNISYAKLSVREINPTTSSDTENLKLTGAAGDLTVSAQGVSALGEDSLTARTSDSSSSAITQWLDNSYLWNVWQLSPVFSVQRRLRAIGNLVHSGDPRARQSIEALLSDNKPEIKAGAAEALGQLRDQSVKGPLLALLSDDSTQVRIAARAALDRLKTPDDQLVGGYIKALSASKEARLEAAKELAQLGRESDTAYEALKSLLKDTDPFVVSIGIESFVTLGNRAIIPTLVDMLDKETNPRVLGTLAFAMGEFKVSDAKQRLKELLRDDMDPTAFSQILQALEKLGDPVSDEFLIAKLRLQNSLSPIAAEHLGKRQSQEARESLIEVLGWYYDRWHTKEAARNGLRNFPELSDLRIAAYDKVKELNGDITLFPPAYKAALEGDDVVIIYHPSYDIEQGGGYHGDSGSQVRPETWIEHVEGYVEVYRVEKETGKRTIISTTASSGIDQINAPQAEVKTASAPTMTKHVGGIDFNSAALDLQIKRDGNGVPLPLPQQTIQNMKIDGFYPVIINIAPVNIPMLLGQKTQQQPQQLSALR